MRRLDIEMDNLYTVINDLKKQIIDIKWELEKIKTTQAKLKQFGPLE